MHAASVGFQCPDDVRSGQRQGRQARTALGGRISPDDSRVTFTLIGVNVLIFLVSLVVPDAFARFGLVPGPAQDPQLGIVGVATGEYYRLVTAAFLHNGPLHLLTNMYALFLVGPALERSLGRLRFLILYVLSALGGSALSYAVHSSGFVGVGASGAVFGLFAALFVISRRLGQDTSFIAVILGVNLVLGFVVPRIDWVAHLGGLATGAALALAFAYAPRGRRDLVQGGAATATLLVIAGIVAVRTVQLTG